MGGLLIKMTRTNPVMLLTIIERRIEIAKRMDVVDSPLLISIDGSMGVMGDVVWESLADVRFAIWLLPLGRYLCIDSGKMLCCCHYEKVRKSKVII